MVTKDDSSQISARKKTKRRTSSRRARAHAVLVSLWSGRILDRLKRKTSSYEHLTSDHADVDGNGTDNDDINTNREIFTTLESDNIQADYSFGSSQLGEKSVTKAESVAVEFNKQNESIRYFNATVNQPSSHSVQAQVNVSGFAALDINSQGNVDSVNTGNFLETPVDQRRHTYYHNSILDLTQTSSPQQDGDESGSVAVNANDAGPAIPYDDNDWQLYYKGKKKGKKKKLKKKTVVHLDTSENTPSIQKDRYVELEEIEEGKPNKKKRKRRRVTSKKIKKGAKKAGKIVWKGTKYSWKWLKYGMIYMTEGPGAALNIHGLSHAYTPSYRFDYK